MRTKEEIRAARTAAGLTQREAAELVGVSLGQWEHYESGRRNMRERIFRLFQERIQERAEICRLRDQAGDLEAWKERVEKALGGES